MGAVPIYSIYWEPFPPCWKSAKANTNKWALSLFIFYVLFADPFKKRALSLFISPRSENGRCPYFFFAGAAARTERQRAIQGLPDLPDKIVAATRMAALRRPDDGFRGLPVE